MTPQLEIAIASCFLAIGMAGPPLEPLGLLLAAVIGALVWRSRRFVGGVAMAGTILAGYLQHHQFHVTLLVAATLLGIAAHLLYRRPRASTAIMGIGALTGLAFLVLG